MVPTKVIKEDLTELEVADVCQHMHVHVGMV
jgi:hypothetical protein